MAKEREVNILVDAKNKAKGTLLEVGRQLKDVGRSAQDSMGKFNNSFKQGGKVVKSFTDKLGFMDKAVSKALKGAAASAGIYIATTMRDFSQLEDGISKVNTLYDQTKQSQDKMVKDSMKMFTLIPTDFNKITQGIYDTISAGMDPKLATSSARKFGMASVAGMTDMDIVTKAAMGTMNAFKKEAQDLNHILDLQFLTVKHGITEYSELASSLGTGVLKSAEGAGISMEELYASIAQITKNAIPANIATTSLIQLFNKFTDSKAIKAFKKIGVDVRDAKQQTRPMIEIMKDLNKQFDKRKMNNAQRATALKELLGSDEAVRALQPLLGDLKLFDTILNDMKNKSGAMQEAFEDRLDNINTQVKLLWNNFKSYGVKHIYALKPLLDSLTEPLKKKQKLEFEIMDLEELRGQTKDPGKRKQIDIEIQRLKEDLASLDLTPIQTFKEGLKESVKELEKINPPLAKFLDTLGSFALSFVGEEGKENREKVGTVAKTVGGVYAFKKIVDAVSWLNKNFSWIGDIGGKGDKNKGGLGDALSKTLKTMNVQAGVVNVYGGSGSGNITKQSSPASDTSQSPKTPLSGPVKSTGSAKSFLGGLIGNIAQGAIGYQVTKIYDELMPQWREFRKEEREKLDNKEKNKTSQKEANNINESKNKTKQSDEAMKKLIEKNQKSIEQFIKTQKIVPANKSIKPANQKVDKQKDSKTPTKTKSSKDVSAEIKNLTKSQASFMNNVSKLIKTTQKDSKTKQPKTVQKNDNKAQQSILNQLKKDRIINSKVDLQNDIKVDAPKVNVSVNIDGKNIPSRVEVKSQDVGKKAERHFEVLGRRTGRLDR